MRKADKERVKEERNKEKLAIKREKEAKASAARKLHLLVISAQADNQDRGRMVRDRGLLLLLRPMPARIEG
jgi:hypothetical protein